MKRLLIAAAAAAAAAAVLVLITAAIATVNIPDVAIAQETEETEPETDATTPSTLEEVLQDLVEDNVITQDQADAVTEALRDAAPFYHHGPSAEGKPEDFEGHRFWLGFHGFGLHGFGFFGAESLEELTGLTSEELREALADGQALAYIVDDPQALIDAIVAQTEERLQAAVDAERLTQEEADELLAQAREQAEAFVNGEGGFIGRGFKPRGFGHRGPWGEQDSHSNAEDASLNI